MNTSDRDRTGRPDARGRVGPPTIGDVMTAAPYTIERDQKLARAYDLMREHSLRHLPVLDGGKLVGVVTQRDLFFAESLGIADRLLDRVSTAMASEAYQVAPGELVADVARTMAANKYGCAVVVDRGRIIGIFTATDALVLLARTTS